MNNRLQRALLLSLILGFSVVCGAMHGDGMHDNGMSSIELKNTDFGITKQIKEKVLALKGAMVSNGRKIIAMLGILLMIHYCSGLAADSRVIDDESAEERVNRETELNRWRAARAARLAEIEAQALLSESSEEEENEEARRAREEQEARDRLDREAERDRLVIERFVNAGGDRSEIEERLRKGRESVERVRQNMIRQLQGDPEGTARLKKQERLARKEAKRALQAANRDFLRWQAREAR